jgi:hypothetical protein
MIKHKIVLLMKHMNETFGGFSDIVSLIPDGLSWKEQTGTNLQNYLS